MFKKHIKNSIIVIFFVAIMSTTTFAQASIVDTENLNKGVIGVNWEVNQDNMKVLISKGSSNANYDLKSDSKYPLQFGDGEYTIQVLEHVSGNQYRQLGREVVSLELEDERDLFLQSTHMLNWDEEMFAISKAKELTKNLKTDQEKVKAIYNYIINNVKYDHDKASKVQAGYIPTIDSTLESKSGICHDYAVLTGSMLRSLDIPTKLIMGYNVDIVQYHAWNEIFVDGEWKTIDTTYDAAYAQKNIKRNMIKDESDYEVIKTY